MPAEPFRARLFAGDRDLGEIQGEIEHGAAGAADWSGHFPWEGSPGLLMAADDLRLESSEAGGFGTVFIKAHTRQLDPADAPPFRFEFRSTTDPSPIDERQDPGRLPTTMQDRLDPE
jgi:hypothetical protein